MTRRKKRCHISQGHTYKPLDTPPWQNFILASNVRFTFFLHYEYTYTHTGLKEKSQEVSVKNSGYIFLKSYLSNNHPITHFLSVRNFSGTFWKPWHLLTGTGLQTEKRKVSWGRWPIRVMLQLARASPKTIKRDSDRWKGLGSWGQMYWSDLRTEPGDWGLTLEGQLQF